VEESLSIFLNGVRKLINILHSLKNLKLVRMANIQPKFRLCRFCEFKKLKLKIGKREYLVCFWNFIRFVLGVWKRILLIDISHILLGVKI